MAPTKVREYTRRRAAAQLRVHLHYVLRDMLSERAVCRHHGVIFRPVGIAAVRSSGRAPVARKRTALTPQRSSRRKILPTGVLGKVSRNSMTLGCL